MSGVKTKRQIVRITGVNSTVAAVCDDGSVWLLAIDFEESFGGRRWVRAPDIPQTKTS